jgi:hypothetical protein
MDNTRRQKCKFFNTRRGCKNGSMCRYEHVKKDERIIFPYTFTRDIIVLKTSSCDDHNSMHHRCSILTKDFVTFKWECECFDNDCESWNLTPVIGNVDSIILAMSGETAIPKHLLKFEIGRARRSITAVIKKATMFLSVPVLCKEIIQIILLLFLKISSDPDVLEHEMD